MDDYIVQDVAKRFEVDSTMRRLTAAALCGIMLPLAAQEWRFYGGDQGSTKYSPLDQINLANVQSLKVAWEWKTGECSRSRRCRYYLIALDAASGKTG